MCGAASLKFSMGGASFGAYAAQIPAFYGQFLGVTGKSLADVSFACNVDRLGNCPDIEAFQVKGLDEAGTADPVHPDADQRRQHHHAGQHRAARTCSRRATATYAYFKGDTVFAIDASSDEQAAVGLALLP